MCNKRIRVVQNYSTPLYVLEEYRETRFFCLKRKCFICKLIWVNEGVFNNEEEAINAHRRLYLIDENLGE